MNCPYKHWAPYPRHFPHPLQVETTNFLKSKKYWIKRTPEYCSFSFIFRGQGELHRQGKVYPYKAPCATSCIPSVYFEAGPIGKDTELDELYFVYNKKSLKYLIDTKLYDPEVPVWPIHNLGRVWNYVEELAALSQTSSPETCVDRIDRVCERMIFESLASESTTTSAEDVIHEIINSMRATPEHAFDFKEIARHHGMSLGTFRRRWTEIINVSPRLYLEQIRIQHACRLLVETKTSIKNIAQSIGFQDELYFSRRFHIRTGTSPRNYRQKHQV